MNTQAKKKSTRDAVQRAYDTAYANITRMYNAINTMRTELQVCAFENMK